MKLNKKMLSYVGVLFAFLVVLTLFFPVMTNGNSQFTGLDVALGIKKKAEGILNFEYGIKMNFLVLLAYLAVILAAVLLFVEPKNALVSAVLFGVATVLFILGPSTVTGFIGNTEFTSNETNLAWGAYVAIILSALGFASNLYGALALKK